MEGSGSKFYVRDDDVLELALFLIFSLFSQDTVVL